MSPPKLFGDRASQERFAVVADRLATQPDPSRGAARGNRAVPAYVVMLGSLCCMAVATFLGLYQLGNRPVSDAEARYAAIGQAMSRTGDWVQPHLNTVRYYEKPPLLYWAMALAYERLGDDEFSSRLPGAIASIGTVLTTYLLGLSLCGPEAAVCAGLVTATSLGWFCFARMALPDSPLTFFLTVALLGLTLTAQGSGSRWPPMLFYMGSAAAGLTKGLVGLFVPFASAAVYAAAIGSWGAVRRLRPGLGAIIISVVFLPWHVALALRDPAFLPYYVWNEHIYRFLNIRDPIDYVPLSVPAFWVATGCWFLPWALFLPAALAWAWRRRRQLAVPLIWSAVVVGFFTLARSRLEKYGLPALPALAVVVGAYWHGIDEQPRRTAAQLVPSVLLIALALAMAAVVFLLPPEANWIGALVRRLDGHYREHPEDVALFLPKATALAKPFCLLVLIVGASTLWSAWTRRRRLTFVLWSAFGVMLLLFADSASGFLVPHRSMRTAATLIEQHWEADAVVVVAGDYEHALSLGYYLHDPLAIVGGRSTDLAFGFHHGDAPQLVYSEVQLQQEWRSSRRIFLLAEPTAVPAGATVLLQCPTYVLVTNRPLVVKQNE